VQCETLGCCCSCVIFDFANDTRWSVPCALASVSKIECNTLRLPLITLGLFENDDDDERTNSAGSCGCDRRRPSARTTTNSGRRVRSKLTNDRSRCCAQNANRRLDTLPSHPNPRFFLVSLRCPATRSATSIALAQLVRGDLAMRCNHDKGSPRNARFL
jgi:hypothetical protein